MHDQTNSDWDDHTPQRDAGGSHHILRYRHIRHCGHGWEPSASRWGNADDQTTDYGDVVYTSGRRSRVAPPRGALQPAARRGKPHCLTTRQGVIQEPFLRVAGLSAIDPYEFRTAGGMCDGAESGDDGFLRGWCVGFAAYGSYTYRPSRDAESNQSSMSTLRWTWWVRRRSGSSQGEIFRCAQACPAERRPAA